jgi:hypothetical protein
MLFLLAYNLLKSSFLDFLKITNFFGVETASVVCIKFKWTQNCDRSVANLALKIAKAPPVALIVEYLQQLSNFDSQLFLVVSLSVVRHLVDPKQNK